MKEIQSVLLDRSASNSKKRKSAQDLSKLSTYLDQENLKQRKDVQALAPIPGFNKGYQRLATANRRAYRKQAPASSVDRVASLIDNGIEEEESTTPPEKPKARDTPKVLTVAEPLLPVPANGEMYSRHECIQAIENREYTLTKSKAVQEILTKKYIPVKRTALYQMLNRWETHKSNGGTLETFPNDDWNNRGRPAFLVIDEIKDIAQELSTTPGKAIGLDELNDKLIERSKEKIEAQGKVLLSESAATPSKDTLRRYGTQLRLLGGVSCPSSAIKKTRTRAIAEASLRSSAAFIAVAAVSHLTITGNIEEHPHVEKFLKEAPESERLVYEAVSDFFGGVPLYPIKSRYLISTDDTTEWAMEGLNKDRANDVFFTAISSYQTKTSSRSLYNTGPAPAFPNFNRMIRTCRDEIDVDLYNLHAFDKLVDVYTGILKLNERCEARLHGILESVPEPNGIAAAELHHFDKCVIPELEAFCHVRTFSTTKKPNKFKWPRKGKSTDLKPDEKCLVELAFECKANPIIITEPKKQQKESTSSEPRYVLAAILRPESSSLGSGNAKLASALLDNSEWRGLALAIYCLDGEHLPVDKRPIIDQALLDRADYLQKLLKMRLAVHVSSSKVPELLHDHWCWHLQHDKAGHTAAVMVFLGHVKTDLHCLNAFDCLLSDHTNFRLVDDEIYEDGVYGYYDKIRHEWRRFGMTAGRKHWMRGMDHYGNARLKSAASRNSSFYMAYPSIEVPEDERPAARQGFFEENLEHRIALGVPIPLDGRESRDMSFKLIELYGFNSQDIDNFSTINRDLCVYGQLRRAAHYMAECAYGLCLARDQNLSSNPGWEQALKYYGA
ncbi:hypothetical protein SEMRO_3122_G344220.1 [Seminavis robusta]|uniref:Uncharacterized protein n=1 Tax=Seminavis robusta TaxID=568900 RepID=A0A9N8F1N9_9STRA|nr:hypothetical protein SEMRO_3122_G344220.1 [Seminavis robusta]|eukprot:Sro3122_g344220.1 n/a (840) ;mRNA; r:539-3289